MVSSSPPRLHRPNIQASKTFVRPLHHDDNDPDSSLRPTEADPFADWDHFKNGNPSTESSPWWKPAIGGWNRADQFIRFNK